MKTDIKIITLFPDSETSLKLQNKIKQQQGIATFFAAVDGREKTPELLSGEQIDTQRTINYRGNRLNSSEIGCYLSHYRCIYEAYNNNIDKICILEDDVDIEDSFYEHLQHIFALPDHFEMIKLMELKRCKRKIAHALSETHQLTRPEKGTLGAQGYIINRAGMKKILQEGSVLWQPIDKLYDHFWETNVHTFVVEPHLIWERETDSSIIKPSFKKPQTSHKNIAWHLRKLKRSIHRKIYILKRARDFYPHKKAQQQQGKTNRKT